MNISNYENVEHRDVRLRKCLRIAIAIMGISPRQADRLLLSLHDHKGDLHVLWFDPPTEAQRAAFQEAWSLCGEYTVHHGVGRAEFPYAA